MRRRQHPTIGMQFHRHQPLWPTPPRRHRSHLRAFVSQTTDNACWPCGFLLFSRCHSHPEITTTLLLIDWQWWVRRCLKCPARKTSRQTIRWPVLSISLPNYPGTCQCRLLWAHLTPRGHVPCDRSRIHRRRHCQHPTEPLHPSLAFPVTASTHLFDNGPQFYVQLATAVYKLLITHKCTTSAYHSSGNGGVEHVTTPR